MKRIILALLLSLLLLPQAAFSNDNFIYAINVNRDKISTGNIELLIKSDYKTDVKNKTDEAGREYFDIKDASLKENFTINYNDAEGIESVIAQQIGNKVRIYVKGNNIISTAISFNNVETQAYPDKSAGYALLVFGLVVFALFRIFKRKATRLKAKAQVLQNTASKAVYNNLMEKRNIQTSKTLRDNRSLTLNSLKKGNVKSIGEYQKQRFIDRVAM